jgi:hypothetical protein
VVVSVPELIYRVNSLLFFRRTKTVSIFKNLEQVHAAVVVDNFKGNPPTLGRRIGNAAIAAIKGGMESPAWKDYMALFASNATELERLTVEKQGERDYLPQFRAYIVSNAVCDAATTTFTSNKVDPVIDDGFTEADMTPDEDFISARKIEIPEI